MASLSGAFAARPASQIKCGARAVEGDEILWVVTELEDLAATPAVGDRLD